MPNQRLVLSVSQLNAEVGQLLNDGFPAIWVEGEISNLSRPRSGHLYFTLKDENAQLRCAMFKNRQLASRLNIENGQKVLARGQVGLYEPRGDYQFLVSILEDAGTGQLQQQFEALKRQLESEGLFATEYKKPIPPFPSHIGVITSPSGAAIKDILNVLKRRCPHIPVTVFPVAVQGTQAKTEIVKALRQANNDKRPQPCDVILLARGGGSIEDLWAFNEEVVARAIADSDLPVISGVGHEIDFTIADFVADQRAPTPSAAAELVSPDSHSLMIELEQMRQRLKRLQNQQQQLRQQQLTTLQNRLNTQKPAHRLQQRAQKLDELDLRLQQAIKRQLNSQHNQLDRFCLRLQHQHPKQNLVQLQQRLNQLQQTLNTQIQRHLHDSEEQLALQAAQLNAFSPLKTLERGYSLTMTARRKLIKSTRQVKAGQKVITQLNDGELECIVEGVQITNL